MNAEMLWLAWTSQGWDIPMVVCRVIAGCVDHWMQYFSAGDRGEFSLSDDLPPRAVSGGEYAFTTDEGKPLPLSTKHIKALKRWTLVYAETAAGHIEPVHLLVGNAEVRAWAQEVEA